MNAPAINTKRLFTASRIAVVATAARFVAISAMMAPLKGCFGLDNEQVGWIGGAGLWGFTLTMLLFGSLCDLFGMKLVFRLAVLAHLAGAMAMCLANGFVMLLGGSLLLSMGDGLVQAAGNPLVVTLFPDRKTEMMNKFHLWFPGGIVICGLIAFALDKAVPDVWQAKLAMVFVPTVLYGAMFLGQRFPTTERVQLGVSFGQMFRETFFRPLFLLLALCMMMTASIELGPNTWLTPVLESAGIPGILVLVWVSLLMALLRQLAGPMVRKLAPLGILLCSAVLSGLGLLGLSYSHNLVTALAAGTVFAVGVAYLWPTMIGITSERVPKGGALALAMMGSVGMVAVGLITVPMMGRVADGHIHEHLPVRETTMCLQHIVETYPALMRQAQGRSGDDLRQALEAAQAALAGRTAAGVLPEPQAVAALRSAIAAAPQSEAAQTARRLIGPAETYGGQVAFRKVALLSIILAAIFGLLCINDRIRGGTLPG
ncbi:MAG: MFS transporter [Planctomycetes bacterium]|nr:MFS transporter [Planctomycetota bacterium]